MSSKCGLILDQDRTKVGHQLQLLCFICDTANQSLALESSVSLGIAPRKLDTTDLIRIDCQHMFGGKKLN